MHLFYLSTSLKVLFYFWRFLLTFNKNLASDVYFWTAFYLFNRHLFLKGIPAATERNMFVHTPVDMGWELFRWIPEFVLLYQVEKKGFIFLLWIFLTIMSNIILLVKLRNFCIYLTGTLWSPLYRDLIFPDFSFPICLDCWRNIFRERQFFFRLCSGIEYYSKMV